MKLAKKLSAITLASAMAVTSIPVTLLADEVTPVESVAVDEVEVEEVAPVEEAVEEAPVVAETVEAVDAMAVNDQAAVDTAKKAVQDAIDATAGKVQKDYTAKAWKALQDEIKKGQALLSATFDNGAAQKFTYVDEEGNNKSLTEAAYKDALNKATDGAADQIKAATAALETKNIKAFAEKVNEVAQLKSDDYNKIAVAAPIFADGEEKTLAEILTKAQDLLRTLSVDQAAEDDEFAKVGTATTEKSMMKYLTDVSAATNKNYKVQLTEAVAKAEDVVTNQKAKYSLKSYNALKDALATAKTKLAGADPIVVGDVEALTKPSDHSGAYDKLVDLEPVQIELAKADKLSNANKDYTAYSWKESQDAIKTVKENLDKALKDADYAYTTVADDATSVALAATEVKDATNAEGYVLVSVKALREANTKAKAVKTGADEDYTATSLGKYVAAVNGADLILVKAEQVGTAVAWDEINNATTGALTKVNNDALGLVYKDASKTWEADETKGLVNIKEAKTLVDENKDSLTAASQDDLTDYLYDANWSTYVAKVNALKTVIITNEGTATTKSVATAVKDVVDAKAKLVKISKTNFKENITKAEAEIAHKDFYKDSADRTTKFEALTKAIEAAKKVTLPTADDVKALDKAISDVKALDLNTKAAALKTAVDGANTVLTTPANVFMNSSKEALEANIKAGQALLDAYETDEDKLTAATKKLDVTEDTGVKFGEYRLATMNGLLAYIADVKDIPSTSFTDEAYAKYVDEINKATTAANKGGATVAEWNAAYEALKAAVANTSNNNQALTDLYNKVKDYNNNMFEEADTDLKWTTFTGKVAAAKAKLDSTDAKAVSDAYNDLKTALEALTPANKTTLQKLLEEKTKDLDEYKYTVASWANLQSVIKEAQKLIAGNDETSAEIKAMQKTKLPDAVTGLVTFTNPAASVTDMLTAGYYIADDNADNYTADSWLAYKAVRDDFAEKLLDLTGATPQVDATKAGKYTSRTETLTNIEKALVNAKDALVRVNGATLEKLVADADKLVEKEYTAETWKAFADALKDAKAALEDGTPSLMVKAEKTLRAAMTALSKDEAKTPATFTKDLFKKVMGRDALDSDVEFFVNAIEKDGWTAAQLVQHFTTTEEFTKKDLSDENFIKAIYEMGLNRTADAEGLAYWMGELANSDRKVVMARILDSKEFGDYCETVGMTKGAVSVAPAAENFIKGLYTACLGRSAAQAEVLAWLPQLTGKKMTGSALAKFFVKSPEFTGKTMTDTEYVTALYKAFFGGVDEAGVNYWVGQIKAGAFTRDTALDFFASSEQFKGICAAAGIEL